MGSLRTWFTACNLEQVANRLCAESNLGSCSQWDGKLVDAYLVLAVR